MRLGAAFMFALSLGSAAAGCGSSQQALPTGPAPLPLRGPNTSAPDPGQSAVGGDRWRLTTTLESFEGPPPCWAARTTVGASIDWLMAVQRGDTSIHMVYDVRNWPTDEVDFTGASAGEQFTASSQTRTVTFPCGDARAEYRFEAQVSGRFSADGESLTATEVWSYRPPSGQTIRFHFNWVATRQ